MNEKELESLHVDWVPLDTSCQRSAFLFRIGYKGQKSVFEYDIKAKSLYSKPDLLCYNTIA